MSTWQELDATVKSRITAANQGERVLFATGTAERLMRAHEALPEEDQREFTLSLRPLLEFVWEAALGDCTAFRDIKQALGSFYLSDYWHNDGQDGPDDADDDTAAAVLFAAEAFMHGCVEFSAWAGARAADAAYNREEEADPATSDPLVDELHRQLRDLDRIAQYAKDVQHAAMGLGVDVIARLRETLRPALSRIDDSQ